MKDIGQSKFDTRMIKKKWYQIKRILWSWIKRTWNRINIKKVTKSTLTNQTKGEKQSPHKSLKVHKKYIKTHLILTRIQKKNIGSSKTTPHYIKKHAYENKCNVPLPDIRIASWPDHSESNTIQSKIYYTYLRLHDGVGDAGGKLSFSLSMRSFFSPFFSVEGAPVALLHNTKRVRVVSLASQARVHSNILLEREICINLMKLEWIVIIISSFLNDKQLNNI